MATNTRTIITDDITGEEGATRRTFAFEGKGYEIDLADNTWAQFKASFDEFLNDAFVKSLFAAATLTTYGDTALRPIVSGPPPLPAEKTVTMPLS